MSFSSADSQGCNVTSKTQISRFFREFLKFHKSVRWLALSPKLAYRQLERWTIGRGEHPSECIIPGHQPTYNAQPTTNHKASSIASCQFSNSQEEIGQKQEAEDDEERNIGPERPQSSTASKKRPTQEEETKRWTESACNDQRIINSNSREKGDTKSPKSRHTRRR